MRRGAQDSTWKALTDDKCFSLEDERVHRVENSIRVHRPKWLQFVVRSRKRSGIGLVGNYKRVSVMERTVVNSGRCASQLRWHPQPGGRRNCRRRRTHEIHFGCQRTSNIICRLRLYDRIHDHAPRTKASCRTRFPGPSTDDHQRYHCTIAG
jgi:hypothetical protein